MRFRHGLVFAAVLTLSACDGEAPPTSPPVTPVTTPSATVEPTPSSSPDATPASTPEPSGGSADASCSEFTDALTESLLQILDTATVEVDTPQCQGGEDNMVRIAAENAEGLAAEEFAGLIDTLVAAHEEAAPALADGLVMSSQIGNLSLDYFAPSSSPEGLAGVLAEASSSEIPLTMRASGEYFGMDDPGTPSFYVEPQAPAASEDFPGEAEHAWETASSAAEIVGGSARIDLYTAAGFSSFALVVTPGSAMPDGFVEFVRDVAVFADETAGDIFLRPKWDEAGGIGFTVTMHEWWRGPGAPPEQPEITAQMDEFAAILEGWGMGPVETDVITPMLVE